MLHRKKTVSNQEEKNLVDVMMSDEVQGVKVGETYKIVKVETFQSAVRGFSGLRIDFENKHGELAVEALWLRPVVGSSSLLGAFVSKLGKDETKWIGKKIRVVAWSEGKRQIEVV